MALTTCKECGEEISNKASKCPKCGAPAKKKTSLFTWLVAIFVVLPLFVGYMAIDKEHLQRAADKPTKESENKAALGLTPKDWLIINTNLDYKNLRHSESGIFTVDFTMKNNNKVAIKDIEIVCEHYAKSKTRIGVNKKTIYDVIPADGKKTFNEFKMGFISPQSVSTSCLINNLRLYSN